jgi:rSAM/selenodomain-associated transferase 1
MSREQALRRSVVVIMAKRPEVGRTKTRLCPPLSPSGAAELYEALLNDTIALVSSLQGIRLAVAVTPPAAIIGWQPGVPEDALLLPVAGADIGVCLSQATGRLFAEGFARVLALNSDGPTLPAAHLERARSLLERSDVVLGPSEDGGYYLVGLRRPSPDLFRDIAWSTARVMPQTLDRAVALGLSVALLPSWYDIDTGADLERLRAELACLPRHALAWTRRFIARHDVSARNGT